VLFGTDALFDAQGGSYCISRTISDIEEAIDSKPEQSAIFHLNVGNVLGMSRRSRL
jgi:hypothetical protein